MTVPRTKAERLAAEIEARRDAVGLVHAEALVEWARKNPGSALYSEFEWDDTEAARAYRIWQARRLIAVCVIADDGERRLVSLTIDRVAGGGYRDVEMVVADDELRRVLVLDALAELKRVRAKYEHVRELAAVYDEIEKADAKYGHREKPEAKREKRLEARRT